MTSPSTNEIRIELPPTSSPSIKRSQQHINQQPSTPLRRYFSRRYPLASSIPKLPAPDDYVGFASPWAVLWFMVHLVVPFAYVYIGLVLLHDVLPALEKFGLVKNYLAPCVRALLFLPNDPDHDAASTITTTSKSLLRWSLEIWCWLEALCYLLMKCHIRWLQQKDPLEASLAAAPLMHLADRARLWARMMEDVAVDPVGFLCGWFFDDTLTNISHYDMREFLAWSMFDGRHQEHLTTQELEQLEEFLKEAEYRLSLQLYGSAVDEDEDEEVERNGTTVDGGEDVDDAKERADDDDAVSESNGLIPKWRKDLPRPKKLFRFPHVGDAQEPSFFSDLYEAYKVRYDLMMSSAPQFRSIQDFREMVSDFDPAAKVKHAMAEAKQTIVGAEETAMATANQMYETMITPGSTMDKQLTAMSHATRVQLVEAWNSVVHMKEHMKDRLEQARIFSKQRQRLTQQLKGYQVMLNRMREMSSAVPAQQMSMLMRRITECNEALEHLEQRAQAAFEQATGFARKNLPFLQAREPRRFAKYSSDPLLGIVTYPLWFCVTLNLATEVPLRVMLHRRGFERRSIGPVRYYFHAGRSAADDDDDNDFTRDRQTTDETDIPIVFVHGIGVGLIAYIPLIDSLLATGRPILLPEIPYVSAFRPLQSPNAVLSPAAVASTMNAMLATHGFMSGTWIGHSYGTTWMSYMIQFASHAVSAVLFLDPICFCLHQPRLTKAFVYLPPDLGQLAYFVRADAIVNWTVQRSFPWAWISLFLDQINVPCTIFLSSKDALVPAAQVETYLRRHNVPVTDFDSASENVLQQPDDDQQFQCIVFRGDGHGGWTERPSETIPTIAASVEVLCQRAEALQEGKRES